MHRPHRNVQQPTQRGFRKLLRNPVALDPYGKVRTDPRVQNSRNDSIRLSAPDRIYVNQERFWQRRLEQTIKPSMVVQMRSTKMFCTSVEQVFWWWQNGQPQYLQYKEIVLVLDWKVVAQPIGGSTVVFTCLTGLGVGMVYGPLRSFETWITPLQDECSGKISE